MINFKKLTESEKFSYAMDFLEKYKLVRKLKPELTSEKDVVAVVAHEFYDNDLRTLANCIKFIDSKTKIDSLDSVDLDDAVDAFEQSMVDEEPEKRKVVQEKQKEIEELESKIEPQNREAKNAEKEYNKKRNKEALIQGLKLVGGVFLLLNIVGLIATTGVLGLAGAVLSFIPTLNASQLVVVALIAWWGISEKGFKKVWGSVKDFFKGKAENRQKELKEAEGKFKSCSENNKELNKKIKEKQSERTKAKSDLDAYISKKDHETEVLKRVRQKSALANDLIITESLINSEFSGATQNVNDEEIIAEMGKKKDELIKSLYIKAHEGKIKSRAELNKFINLAKVKFSQLSNPLNVGEEVAVGDEEAVLA